MTAPSHPQIQFARDQARLTRLRAELGEAAQLDRQGFVDTPIWFTVLTEIGYELLVAASDDYRKEKQHLQGSVVQEGARIALMVEHERQKEGPEAESGQYEQTGQHFERKFVTITRLAEARRVQLFLSTRVLQTTSLVAQTEREGQERMIRSQLVGGNRGKPDLTIVRRDGPALICARDSSPTTRSCRPCGSRADASRTQRNFLARSVDFDGGLGRSAVRKGIE